MAATRIRVRFTSRLHLLKQWRRVMTNLTGRETEKLVHENGDRFSFDVCLSAADTANLIPDWTKWQKVIEHETLN